MPSDLKAMYEGKYRDNDSLPAQVGYDSYYNQATRWRVLADATLLRDWGVHGTVLDVGCGMGQFSSYLKGRARHYHGVDMVQEYIDEAKRCPWTDYPIRHFVCANFMTYPSLDHTFDMVAASGTFAWQEPEVVVRMLQKMWAHTNHILAFNLSPLTMGPLELRVHLQNMDVRHIVQRQDYNVPNDITYYCYRNPA